MAIRKQFCKAAFIVPVLLMMSSERSVAADQPTVYSASFSATRVKIQVSVENPRLVVLFHPVTLAASNTDCVHGSYNVVGEDGLLNRVISMIMIARLNESETDSARCVDVHNHDAKASCVLEVDYTVDVKICTIKGITVKDWTSKR